MEYIRICLEGILLGLGLAVMLGPAFFALLQTSIERSFRAAANMAVGITLSDFTMVALSFLGASRVFSSPHAKHIVGVIGGIILILIGIHTFRKKVNIMEELDPASQLELPSEWTYLVKGFFMNMANPGTWLFWLFWVGVVSAQNTSEKGLDYLLVILFFAMSLLTVFITDIGKAFLAHQLKSYIKSNTVKIINRVVGVILGVFGFYLFAYSITDFIRMIIQWLN